MADNDGMGTVSINDVIGRKSWVAYLGFILRYIFYFLVLIAIDYADFGIDQYVIYLYLFFGALFIYRMAVIRSFQIYSTNQGIYYQVGILPWAKASNGIRWGDIDMPFYYPNFISWITNSYKVMIAHKYTNTSDFNATNIWRGRKVVQTLETLVSSNIK